jgi:uncharacterized LabA/DUF88 family protein
VRVRCYVDGFNLYFGLKAAHGRRWHWLDVEHLAESLLKPHQQLEQVDYFTARVRNDPDAEQRQATYLDALSAHCRHLRIIAGRYQAKRQRCRVCHAVWTVYEEKETDVHIAVTLTEDAALDRFDTALVVSADSDLCPAIDAIKRIAPQKRVIVAFPPKRHSHALQAAADAAFRIGDAKLRQAQLPNVVPADGIKLRRPTHWS